MRASRFISDRRGAKALVIANGVLPSPRLVKRLASGVGLIVCADGGANGARTMGIRPDVILGDLDSILPATRTHFRGVPQMLVDDQESTDMEKALRHCIERGMRQVDVVGATGGRVDHTTGNLGCFKKFGDRLDMRFIDGAGVLTLIRGEARLRTAIGEKLSLIPLGRCTGVTTQGMKYVLKNDVLELGVREGISNESVDTTVKIMRKTGTMLLYRFHSGTL